MACIASPSSRRACDERAADAAVCTLRAGARAGLLLAGGLLAAGSVVLVGPIAFVGLLSPHLARLLVGPRHGRLVLATVAAGAAVLLGADLVRQLVDLG